MDLRKYMAVATALIPLNCAADFQINLNQFTCSGSQQTESIVNLKVDCDGDLMLKGGTLSANTDIALGATGTLTLDDVVINTPGKFFSTSTNLVMLGTVRFPESSKSGTGSPVVLEPSTTGTLPSNVVITVPGGGGGGNDSPCTASSFQIKQTTKLSCPNSRTSKREVAYVSVSGECSGEPTSFTISRSQDFQGNGSTFTAYSHCNKIGKTKTACVIHHAEPKPGGVAIMPPVFAGSLLLTRHENGQIAKLSGRTTQLTADGCQSDAELKSISRF